MEVLGKRKFVAVWPIDPTSEWRNFSSMLLKPYKTMRTSGLRITTNHIFSATMDYTNTLRFFMRVSDLAQHPSVHG
jgi:hypothetical protein